MMVINTPTIDDYEEVVQWALDQGMCWRQGEKSILRGYWSDHGSDMCVVIENNKLTYCGLDYAYENLDNIVNMEQFYKHTERSILSKYNLK